MISLHLVLFLSSFKLSLSSDDVLDPSVCNCDPPHFNSTELDPQDLRYVAVLFNEFIEIPFQEEPLLEIFGSATLLNR